jgi:hypothetical protein
MTDQHRALIAPFAERFNMAVEQERKAREVAHEAQRAVEEAARLKLERLMDLRRVVAMIEPKVLTDDGSVEFDTFSLKLVYREDDIR